MAVIINDFEIVPDQSDQSETDESTPFEPAMPPVPTPGDIIDILRHHAERKQRLWAH